MFDITCWTVAAAAAAAVWIILQPDTSPGRIWLLAGRQPPRTACWEAEMWVRPEVLRRDKTDPHPIPPPTHPPVVHVVSSV